MPWPTKKKFDTTDKLFLRTDEVVNVQFLEEEPALYYTHYIEGKTTKCSGDGCIHCNAGSNRNTKGAIKVHDMADGREKMLSGTSALFESIRQTVEMVGNIKDFIFSIKAIGEKSQRRYIVVTKPLPAIAKKAKPIDDDVEVPF